MLPTGMHCAAGITRKLPGWASVGTTPPISLCINTETPGTESGGAPLIRLTCTENRLPTLRCITLKILLFSVTFSVAIECPSLVADTPSGVADAPRAVELPRDKSVATRQGYVRASWAATGY